MVKDGEIIIVDDCLRDRTGEIADSMATGDAHISVVHHKPNQGYGMALRGGFAAAAAKTYVFCTHGDEQFDTGDLDVLLSRPRQADIISGHRSNRQDNSMRRDIVRGW